jgi:uncharacterized cupin superfamily protein
MKAVSVTRAELEPQRLRPGYSGPETHRDATVAESGDGGLTIGVWSYDGELVSENPGEAHQAWLVLAGELTVRMDGEELTASEGDLVFFEAPYGPKTLEASDGFRAVWIAAPRQ